DGDGQIDEGCACTPGQTRQCGPATDAGECAYGTQTCTAGAWGECVGAIYPTAEICNDNIDNDCDAKTDCDDDNCAEDSACAPTIKDCGQSYFDPSIRGKVFSLNTPIYLNWTRQSSMFPIAYKLAYQKEGTSTWTDIATISQLSYMWNHKGLAEGTYNIRIIPNDGYNDGTQNITQVILANIGIIEGYVKCGNVPVENALISIKGTTETTKTNMEGFYRILNVPEAPSGGGYITASKEGRRMETKEYTLKEGETIGVNFANVCPITLDCEPDCTIKGKDICVADCSGFSEDLNDDEIITADERCDLHPLCSGVKMGLMVDNPNDPSGLTKLLCCEGEIVPVSTEKTRFKLDVETEDVIRTTRIVYYKGQPVKMIVIAWQK
ncbi:MAG: hypothetical protein N3D84_02110, partial [Candidatus Woesearchaeota archaeon]|nr:hypothetical protein [Candidatus Woesearchaeota archaeon]